MRAVLTDDVTFRSPVSFTTYQGVAVVLPLLLVARRVLADIEYTDRVADGAHEVLLFQASIDGRFLQGIDDVSYDADGLVVSLTVLVRPLSGLQSLAKAMAAALAG